MLLCNRLQNLFHCSKDEFVKLKEQYQEEIDELTEELKTEREKNVMVENKEELVKEICSVVTNLVQFETFDDSIAKEVLEQIIINSKSDLEVYLKGIPGKTFFLRIRVLFWILTTNRTSSFFSY